MTTTSSLSSSASPKTGILISAMSGRFYPYFSSSWLKGLGVLFAAAGEASSFSAPLTPVFSELYASVVFGVLYSSSCSSLSSSLRGSPTISCSPDSLFIWSKILPCFFNRWNFFSLYMLVNWFALDWSKLSAFTSFYFVCCLGFFRRHPPFCGAPMLFSCSLSMVASCRLPSLLLLFTIALLRSSAMLELTGSKSAFTLRPVF